MTPILKRILKWLGIGLVSSVILAVVLGIIFGESEEQAAASVSTPTLVPTTTAPQHLSAGDNYFDDEEYLLALTEYKMIQGVNNDPIYLRLSYYWIGKTHYKLGSYSAAVDSYSQALGIEKACDAYLQRGIAYHALGRQGPFLDMMVLEWALSDFNASIYSDLTMDSRTCRGEAFFERAKLWSLVGESDKAAQDLVDARKLSPHLFE